jgi:3-isopropylmalate/(R)-2-methylmalate dehydratase large subunit
VAVGGGKVSAPLTLFDKIWNCHVVMTSADGESLLYIDRNLVHEGSFLAFELLAKAGSRVRRPSGSIAFVDHFAPTRRIGGERAPAIYDEDGRRVIVQLEANSKVHGLKFFGLDDEQQGIMHVVGPELGLVLPGFVVTGNDSHTCTNGAFGVLAFGIGQSEIKQVFETQTVWRRKSKTMRVRIDGQLPPWVSSKDVALALIGHLGAGAGTGYVIEYAGSSVADMSMEARMTLCNMSIEAGARSGMVGPDATTLEYLARCSRAPKGAEWDKAIAAWKALTTDRGATFDREVNLDVDRLAPQVTWGISLDQACSIEGRIPQLAEIEDLDRRAVTERALAYMALTPGTPLQGVPIDRAFIGSCTNSRIEDLRVAADVLRNRRVRVSTLVSPGSMQVKRQAESERLDHIFISVGSNGDIVPPRERCATSSPRNFEGRQGIGARTHVMSPAMVAAAAVAGAIVDVRAL